MMKITRKKEEKIPCPKCGGIMEPAHTSHPIKELGVTLEDVPCLKCRECGEELYLGEHVKTIQDRMKRLGIFGWNSLIGKEIDMTVTSSGRRLVVGIPKEVERALDISVGERAKIKVKDMDNIEITFTKAEA